MPPKDTKRKYIFPVIGILILCMLVAGVFYSLMFGKKIFEGAVGGANAGNGTVVQFEFQKIKGLDGISEQ